MDPLTVNSGTLDASVQPSAALHICKNSSPYNIRIHSINLCNGDRSRLEQMNKCFFDGGLFIIVVAATALAAAHENDKNRFNVCIFSFSRCRCGPYIGGENFVIIEAFATVGGNSSNQIVNKNIFKKRIEGHHHKTI